MVLVSIVQLESLLLVLDLPDVKIVDVVEKSMLLLNNVNTVKRELILLILVNVNLVLPIRFLMWEHVRVFLVGLGLKPIRNKLNVLNVLKERFLMISVLVKVVH